MRKVNKRDRQQVRTAADLENKYDFANMANQQDSGKDSSQIKALRQEMARFMAATNAAIAELSSQRIISSASGEGVEISDGADARLVSMSVGGPCELARIMTSASDGACTEAVFASPVILQEGDRLLLDSIVRAGGTVEALSDADKEVLNGLRTFKGVTTISTEPSAVVSIEYVADPKAYIDNLLRGG